MKDIMKAFGAAAVAGAGWTVGFAVGAKLIETFSDPVKRAAIKNKFVDIKNAIFTKKEGH